MFNGSAQLAGGLGEGSVRHAEYLLQLSAAWHRDSTRGLWLQEVGAPANVVDHGDLPEFLTRTIGHAAGVPGLWGVTWWCSHDVSRSLADFPALEYDLGLFTADGELKPTGRAFAEQVARWREATPPPPPGVALLLDDTDADEYRRRCAPGGSFARAWLDLAQRFGRGPQVVLRSSSPTSADLAARGITEVLDHEGRHAAAVDLVAHPAMG